MAEEDNGEATPNEYHKTSDSAAPVAQVSVRARDSFLYTVYVRHKPTTICHWTKMQKLGKQQQQMLQEYNAVATRVCSRGIMVATRICSRGNATDHFVFTAAIANFDTD